MADDQLTLLGIKADIIPGLGKNCEFTTGEYCAKVGANWDRDAKPEFLLDHDSPRYRRCLEEARKLKEQYPLETLDAEKDWDKIIEYERKIVFALNNKIHKEYGDYNPAIAKQVEEGVANPSHESLHKDAFWANMGFPVSLSDFEKDELVCRHFAPLMAAVCTEAGVPTLAAGGYMHHYTIKDHKVIDGEHNEKYSHIYLISRITGNVIEPTSEYSAYKEAATRLSLASIIAGDTIIVGKQSEFTTYNTGKIALDSPIHTFSGESVATLVSRRFDKIRKGEMPEESINVSKAATNKYDHDLVTQHYDIHIRPKIELREKWQPTIDTIVEKQDLALFKELMSSGTLKDHEKMHLYSQCIRAQSCPEMAEYLLDNGVLEYWDQQNEVKKQQGLPVDSKAELLLTFADMSKPLDEEFNLRIMSKLGVTPENILEQPWQDIQYLDLAIKEMSRQNRPLSNELAWHLVNVLEKDRAMRGGVSPLAPSLDRFLAEKAPDVVADLSAFHKAVDAGDLEALKAIKNIDNIPKELFMQGALKHIESKQSPEMSAYLIEKATARVDFTRIQMNWTGLSALNENGLKYPHTWFSVDKHDVLLLVPDPQANKPFMNNLIQKLDIKPEDYLETAARAPHYAFEDKAVTAKGAHRIAEHVTLALEAMAFKEVSEITEHRLNKSAELFAKSPHEESQKAGEKIQEFLKSSKIMHKGLSSDEKEKLMQWLKSEAGAKSAERFTVSGETAIDVSLPKARAATVTNKTIECHTPRRQ